MTCLDSGNGVWRETSTGIVGMRHVEKKSYWAMHIGLLRNTSGGTASLEPQEYKQNHSLTDLKKIYIHGTLRKSLCKF